MVIGSVETSDEDMADTILASVTLTVFERELSLLSCAPRRE